ncbi:MAG: hypothetical protein FWG44_05730 [Oscillospiraceae bacterium]|nr:hypothetical protein [Oscillospiraceae bacterium]
MSDSQVRPPELKLLMVVIEQSDTSKMEDFLKEKQIRFHYMISAKGTARGDILSSLGLNKSEKTICAFMTRAETTSTLVSSLTDRFSLYKPGNGIIYSLPVSGISAVVLELIKGGNNERMESLMEGNVKEKKEETTYSLIISVINQGYSEILMDAARFAGARGGTVINARHVGIEDSVKFFGVTLQAEKEIVAIVTSTEHKTELMKAISQECGLNTDAHGIIISVPVENCAGFEIPK